jgi:phosphate transport system protein
MSGRNYEQDLADIDRDVAALFSLVRHAVTSAVHAMVAGDRAIGHTVVERDSLIDSLYVEIETLARLQFALQSPASLDMSYLLTVLRIVPELERSGDLAEHIGKQAARGSFDAVPDDVRRVLVRLGDIVVSMWGLVEAAFNTREAVHLEDLKAWFDSVDSVHEHFIAEVVAGDVTTPLAIEMALSGRYLSRLCAHAFQIGRRMQPLRPDVPRRTSKANPNQS